MLQSGHPDQLEAVVDQTIGMMEAKSRLAELVGRVAYGGQRYVLERRGRPMAMLISIEEYEQLRAHAEAAKAPESSPLPPELRRRQEALVARAIQLRKEIGLPEDRLGELFADLPPEDDDFWVEIQELA